MLSGIGHPVIGIDHLAFLVVAALLSFTLRGNARYLVPVAFIAATVVGTLIHFGAADSHAGNITVAVIVLLIVLFVIDWRLTLNNNLARRYFIGSKLTQEPSPNGLSRNTQPWTGKPFRRFPMSF